MKATPDVTGEVDRPVIVVRRQRLRGRLARRRRSGFLRELRDDPAHLAALVGEGDVLAAMAPLLARHAPGADPAAIHDVFCASPVLDQDLLALLPNLRCSTSSAPTRATAGSSTTPRRTSTAPGRPAWTPCCMHPPGQLRSELAARRLLVV